MDMQDERKEQERREAVHKIALRLAEQEIHWNAKYYSSFSLPPMRFYKKAWAVLIRQERAAAASTSSAPSFSSSLDWDVQILGNDQAREEGRSNNATEEEEEGEEEQEEQEEEQEAEERINVFEAVPTEVVLLIINHLEAWELRYVVPRVCRQWRALALDWSVQGKVVKDYLRERSRWEKDPANREEYKKRRLVVAPPAETIQIQLGRRATDVGHKYWESLYYEHSIDPHTGEYKVKPNGAGPISEAQVSGLSFSFSEMEDGTYKPRTLFVDTHSSPLFDQQQAFYESPLFPPSCTGRFYLVDDTYSLDEWSCNNTSLSAMMDHLSRLAEKCDNLSNFDFLADIGDLDGGYATDFVFNATVDAFMTTRPVAFCLFSPKSNPSADLIRSTAMAFNSLIELTDATFLLSDLAMTTNNKNIMMTTEQKDRIAAKAFSGITCPMRFPVQGNEAMGSWLKFSTTFNPYPRLHCYSVAYAQVMPQLQSFTPQHGFSPSLSFLL
ncbi:alpha-tubulin, variant 2 [Balamuthia mandrillaris]